MAADVRTGASRTPAAPPEGRYGRYGRYGHAAGEGDARADRRLKIIGAVLGAVLLAVIGWIGVSYISGQDVSAELIKFKVVSDSAAEAHLEIRKEPAVEGVCTLRAQAESGAEVGRKDVTVARDGERADRVVTLRTTSRATSVELLGCTAREATGRH